MSKSTHPVINKFMEAVYPENTELAFAFFNEITALGDAADEILSLRARVKELEGELSQARKENFSDDFNFQMEAIKKAEARLAQAEGLLEVCDLAYIKGGPYPVWKIHAFLHPEQEKNT